MSEPIITQSPTAPDRLTLLFHGVGSTPENLIPSGQRVAAGLPGSIVISVPSADPCDMGAGFQWFSVRGVTEENRVQRVASAMPRFLATIENLQREYRMAAAQTDVVGFSQGAITTLEASQPNHQPARRIISLAGRFASPPEKACGRLINFHLIHGINDPVISVSHCMNAHSQLLALGAQCMMDLIPSLAHGINATVAGKVVQHLAQALNPALPA